MGTVQLLGGAARGDGSTRQQTARRRGSFLDEATLVALYRAPGHGATGPGQPGVSRGTHEVSGPPSGGVPRLEEAVLLSPGLLPMVDNFLAVGFPWTRTMLNATLFVVFNFQKFTTAPLGLGLDLHHFHAIAYSKQPYFNSQSSHSPQQELTPLLGSGV